MLIEFLKTERTKEELQTTLAVLREFKACRSDAEYMKVPQLSWMRLDQLEEFLAYLANGEALPDDTRAAMARAGINVKPKN